MPFEVRDDPRVHYRWKKGNQFIKLPQYLDLPDNQKKGWKLTKYNE